MNRVKILSIEHLTHDVLKIVTKKPVSIQYQPGQAVDIAINKQNWKQERRSFTFTSLPEDKFLEFTIKTYPSHKGVTQQLLTLTKGDELFLHGVFGNIIYKGEGIFIAGGSGITPFIAILKQLEKEDKVGNNKLIFANKTRADIILEKQFHNLLGDNFINVLSEEKIPYYEHGYISTDLIKKYSTEHSRYFYLCGPKPMIQILEQNLLYLGISDSYIVKEEF